MAGVDKFGILQINYFTFYSYFQDIFCQTDPHRTSVLLFDTRFEKNKISGQSNIVYTGLQNFTETQTSNDHKPKERKIPCQVYTVQRSTV